MGRIFSNIKPYMEDQIFQDSDSESEFSTKHPHHLSHHTDNDINNAVTDFRPNSNSGISHYPGGGNISQKNLGDEKLFSLTSPSLLERKSNLLIASLLKKNYNESLSFARQIKDCVTWQTRAMHYNFLRKYQDIDKKNVKNKILGGVCKTVPSLSNCDPGVTSDDQQSPESSRQENLGSGDSNSFLQQTQPQIQSQTPSNLQQIPQQDGQIIKYGKLQRGFSENGFSRTKEKQFPIRRKRALDQNETSIPKFARSNTESARSKFVRNNDNYVRSNVEREVNKSEGSTVVRGNQNTERPGLVRGNTFLKFEGPGNLTQPCESDINDKLKFCKSRLDEEDSNSIPHSSNAISHASTPIDLSLKQKLPLNTFQYKVTNRIRPSSSTNHRPSSLTNHRPSSLTNHRPSSLNNLRPSSAVVCMPTNNTNDLDRKATLPPGFPTQQPSVARPSATVTPCVQDTDRKTSKPGDVFRNNTRTQRPQSATVTACKSQQLVSFGSARRNDGQRKKLSRTRWGGRVIRKD